MVNLMWDAAQNRDVRTCGLSALPPRWGRSLSRQLRFDLFRKRKRPPTEAASKSKRRAGLLHALFLHPAFSHHSTLFHAAPHHSLVHHVAAVMAHAGIGVHGIAGPHVLTLRAGHFSRCAEGCEAGHRRDARCNENNLFHWKLLLDD
jgi:hypothetical protein